jgi:hypothetical protein
MRRSFVALSLATLALAGIARAEVTTQPVSDAAVQQYGALAVALLQQQAPKPPFKTDPNPEKAIGYQVKDADKEGYVILMPDKAFTVKALDEATEKGTPVGVLATTSITIDDKDKLVGASKLAIIDLNGEVKIPLFYLSLKRKGDDRILDVYSKEGAPLLSLPLKKGTADATAPLGLKITKVDQSTKKLELALSLGAYQTTLKMGYLAL